MEEKIKKRFVIYSGIGGIFSILIGCYLWFGCKDYCVHLFISNYSSIVQGFLTYIKKALIILFMFVFFKTIQLVFIRNILRKIMQKIGTIERYNSISKITNFGLWTIFVFMAFSTLIGNITALIASLGLVGFGLTFALQKPILNFVGWLTIIFKDIYHEGDRIKINNVIGDVKEIQIMNTIVEGLLESSDVLSGKTISFPNELILSTDVQNYTKDSNYIVNELSISITYESDYHKAMNILREIIITQVTKNKQKYIKKLTKQKMQLNGMITRWLDPNKTSKEEDEKKEELEIERIKHEKESLENDLKSIGAEFIPLIRIEMLDSAIQLIAQFKSPYNEIKENRTVINIAFLDAIKKETNIEVAYPHMQLVK
ncbi:MAG: mechanosensitive ion channel domain-containing protein [Nanoarchaeota archaeon]